MGGRRGRLETDEAEGQIVLPALLLQATMQTITVALGSEAGERSYPIYIGVGILSRPELFLDRLPQKRVAIVSNTTVAPLYMEKLRAALGSRDVVSVPVILPDGEEHKNWQTLNLIYDAL